MNTNKKAATSGKARAASRLHNTLNSISTTAWRLAYSLEEARQLHAVRGHFWKEAGLCIALAFLRLGRLV